MMNEIITGTNKRVRLPIRNVREIAVPIELVKVICADITDDQKNAVLVHTYDFKRIVGENECLEILEQDELKKARPKGERYEVFFEVSRKAEPTTMASVAIISVDNDEYMLIDSCFGEYRPPYWWKIQDPEKREVSQKFWETHAWCKKEEEEEEEKEKAD